MKSRHRSVLNVLRRSLNCIWFCPTDYYTDRRCNVSLFRYMTVANRKLLHNHISFWIPISHFTYRSELLSSQTLIKILVISSSTLADYIKWWFCIITYYTIVNYHFTKFSVFDKYSNTAEFIHHSLFNWLSLIYECLMKISHKQCKRGENFRLTCVHLGYTGLTLIWLPLLCIKFRQKKGKILVI